MCHYISLKIRKCCNNSSKYKITYDCGPEKNQTILVCEKHFLEEPFHKFVISIENLE